MHVEIGAHISGLLKRCALFFSVLLEVDGAGWPLIDRRKNFQIEVEGVVAQSDAPVFKRRYGEVTRFLAQSLARFFCSQLLRYQLHVRTRGAGGLLAYHAAVCHLNGLLLGHDESGGQNLRAIDFSKVGFQELRVDEQLVVCGNLDPDIAKPCAVDLQRNFDLVGAAGRIELHNSLRGFVGYDL